MAAQAAAAVSAERTAALTKGASWWPRVGNRVVMASGEKEEEVWRDVEEGEAAGLEAGTVVMVERKQQQHK